LFYITQVIPTFLWYDILELPFMEDKLLNKAIKVLLFTFLLALVLHYGKPFFVPVTFAGLLSMLLLPFSLKLETWGVNKAISVVLSILLVVLFFGGIITLLVWQISDISQDASQIEQSIQQKIQQVKQYLSSSLGISQQKQQELTQKQQGSGGKLASALSAALTSVGTVLTNFLLVLVYIFLFMYFRDHLKKFVLKFFAKTQQAEASKVIESSRKVAQKYITGLMLMIIGLWIMYSIGFAIVGVKNFFFFAILCGLLEIVPFVGNLIGNILTIVVSLAQGGDMNMVIGILVTYGLVQFIQSYILEPLVVGSEVSINPVFTIIGIVAGEFIWGIAGMILAIPVLGITKIICDHVESLKPFGFLIGEEKKKNSSMIEKIKNWFN
jgi:predicted PurR-regulated permease PerM